MSTGKSLSLNKINTKTGEVVRDATNNTEIVNYRTMASYVANNAITEIEAVGTGEPILRNGDTSTTGPVAQVRSIQAGANIEVTTTADTITITAPNVPVGEVASSTFNVLEESTALSEIFAPPTSLLNDTVYLTIWGGGGGGAGGAAGAPGGSGGAGAAIVNFPWRIKPGEFFNLLIGGGGVGGTGAANGDFGGLTRITNNSGTLRLTAGGGGPGIHNAAYSGSGGAVDVTGAPSGKSTGLPAIGSTFLNAPDSLDTNIVADAHAVNNGYYWAGAGGGGATGGANAGIWWGRSDQGADNSGKGGAAGFNGNGGDGGAADANGENAEVASGAGGGGGGVNAGAGDTTGGRGGSGGLIIRYESSLI